MLLYLFVLFYTNLYKMLTTVYIYIYRERNISLHNFKVPGNPKKLYKTHDLCALIFKLLKPHDFKHFPNFTTF